MDTFDDATHAVSLPMHDSRAPPKAWTFQKRLWVKALLTLLVLAAVLWWLLSSERFTHAPHSNVTHTLGRALSTSALRRDAHRFSFRRSGGHARVVRHGWPPLEINVSSYKDCMVFSSTLCTMFPFEGCEDCEHMLSRRAPSPDEHEYVLEDVCYLAFRSPICDHYPEVGACHTCSMMFPGGVPYYVEYKQGVV